MRHLIVFAALLTFPLSCRGDLKIGGDLAVPRDRLIVLTAQGDTAGAALIWDTDREDVADVREEPGKLYMAAPPGVYKVKLRAVRIKDGVPVIETARATVTVGDAPDPGPGPQPAPDDATSKSLQAAYRLDTEPTRAASLAFLRDVYRGAAPLAVSQPFKTNAEAVTWMHGRVAAPGVGLSDQQLVNTRKAVGAEASAAFGTSPSAPYDGVKFAAFLTRIADALGKVK